MKNAPCAKFTMRMMPKISVSPTPRKNSSAACESALRHWVTRKARKSINPPPWPGLGQPSTSFLLQTGGKDVDGRAKPGHDDKGAPSAVERHLPASRSDL